MSLDFAESSDTLRDHLRLTDICGFCTFQVSLEFPESSDTLREHLHHTAICDTHSFQVALKFPESSDTWQKQDAMEKTFNL